MSTTTGGEGLRRHLREARANAGETVIDVGFKGNVATLAAQHEFGNPRARLPERPAFRASLGDLVNIIDESKATTPEEIEETAVLMRDAVKTSYLNFHGAPLSERQQERKAGTKYAQQQLVGAEGPKLVEHIGAWVDDEKIG